MRLNLRNRVRSWRRQVVEILLAVRQASEQESHEALLLLVIRIRAHHSAVDLERRKGTSFLVTVD